MFENKYRDGQSYDRLNVLVEDELNVVQYKNKKLKNKKVELPYKKQEEEAYWQQRKAAIAAAVDKKAKWRNGTYYNFYD